jgi:DNA-binding MarR family transcriptional regulator
MTDDIRDEDYETLAAFRYQLRRFLRFSEKAAAASGLSVQQYQALLAIRAEPAANILIGELAERLLLQPHSATGLVDRLQRLGVVRRTPAPDDRRQTRVTLTTHGEQILASLAATHRQELARIGPLLTQVFARL